MWRKWGDNTREFIIQWNNRSLDLFEYKKEHKIALIIRNTYVLNIVEFLKEVEDRSVIHIENCPAFYILNQELSKLNIDNGMCSDAEKWLKYRWRARLPQVNFISYWEHIRPPRVDELEQVKFIGDWDLLLGENDYKKCIK